MGGMEHIRNTYNVPAKRGGRIRFEKRDTGTIVAARHGRLRVRFDGQKRIAFLHPTWQVEYLPNIGRTGPAASDGTVPPVVRD